jgi:hypothetical protein
MIVPSLASLTVCTVPEAVETLPVEEGEEAPEGDDEPEFDPDEELHAVAAISSPEASTPAIARRR